MNNNCYMNSSIQCILNIQSFKENILSSADSKDPITKNLSLLFETFSSSSQIKSSSAVEIKKFLSAVRRENELFNNDYHHDAPEFLFWLLDHIHEFQLKDGKKSSFISKIFHGKQYSITRCLTCEYKFKREESYVNLPVDIESNVSLTSCLKRYIGKELMQHKDKYYCDNCNNLQEGEKK